MPEDRLRSSEAIERNAIVTVKKRWWRKHYPREERSWRENLYSYKMCAMKKKKQIGYGDPLYIPAILSFFFFFLFFLFRLDWHSQTRRDYMACGTDGKRKSDRLLTYKRRNCFKDRTLGVTLAAASSRLHTHTQNKIEFFGFLLFSFWGTWHWHLFTLSLCFWWYKEMIVLLRRKYHTHTDAHLVSIKLFSLRSIIISIALLLIDKKKT